MSLIGLYDQIKEQMSQIRTLECTNRIMHEMLKGNTEATCILQNEKELKLNHGDYLITNKGDTYTIKWGIECPIK